MTKFGLLTFIMTASFLLCAEENHYTSSHQWRVEMLQMIHHLAEQNNEHSIDRLGSMIRKLSTPIHRERPDQPVFDAAQAALISIPGHAKYYSTRIWDTYSAYKNPDSPEHIGSMDRYLSEIISGMGVLRNTPSPETVGVLGDMLSEEWVKEPNPGSTVVPVEALASSAVIALGGLHLRNPPTPPFMGYDAMDRLPHWQAWWEEVKSGSRAFSFKGQAVEYRFNPDGTWETLPIANPPDDAPRPPTQEANTPSAPSSSTPPPEDPPSPEPSRRPIWVWLVLIVPTAALLLIAVRLVKKRIFSQRT